jgi:hypothetical protein
MNTGAHPLRAGFNQSGGAYFMTLANLELAAGTATGGYINALVSGASNSGGAFVNPTLSTVTMSNILGAGVTATGAASLVAANRLLKDMGKTVVSSGRVFRKFAPVAGNASNGVVGGPAGAPTAANTGYGSFYLEVGMGQLPAPSGAPAGTGLPAPIARYA